MSNSLIKAANRARWLLNRGLLSEKSIAKLRNTPRDSGVVSSMQLPSRQEYLDGFNRGTNEMLRKLYTDPRDMPAIQEWVKNGRNGPKPYSPESRSRYIQGIRQDPNRITAESHQGWDATGFSSSSPQATRLTEPIIAFDNPLQFIKAKPYVVVPYGVTPSSALMRRHEALEALAGCRGLLEMNKHNLHAAKARKPYRFLPHESAATLTTTHNAGVLNGERKSYETLMRQMGIRKPDYANMSLAGQFPTDPKYGHYAKRSPREIYVATNLSTKQQRNASKILGNPSTATKINRPFSAEEGVYCPDPLNDQQLDILRKLGLSDKVVNALKRSQWYEDNLNVLKHPRGAGVFGISYKHKLSPGRYRETGSTTTLRRKVLESYARDIERMKRMKANQGKQYNEKWDSAISDQINEYNDMLKQFT